MKRLFVAVFLFFVQLGAMKRSATKSSFCEKRESGDLRRHVLGMPRDFQISKDLVIGKSALGTEIRNNDMCLEFSGCGHVFTEEELNKIASEYNVPLGIVYSRCSICHPFDFLGTFKKLWCDCALFMGWRTAYKYG